MEVYYLPFLFPNTMASTEIWTFYVTFYASGTAFFYSWGEITPISDNVAILYGLPIIGTHSPLDPPTLADCEALIQELTQAI